MTSDFKFSDSRWSKRSLTRCYTCKLRCQILALKGIYSLPFSQNTQKDLESEAERFGINLKYLSLIADHLWVNFVLVDAATWNPKEGHRSSWNLHALVWKTTRTLGYLNKTINSTAVRGHLQLYNIGHEAGFPRIQLGIGHSGCGVYPLNALWSGRHGNCWDRKPGNLLQCLCCPHSTAQGHFESTFWILWIYLLQTSSLVFTFIMKC